RLPHLLDIPVPAPDEKSRRHFVAWYRATLSQGLKLDVWASDDALARATAGLSIHALMQLLKGAVHQRITLSQNAVTEKVAAYIKSQLGEDMVEMKKPSHTLDDVVSFESLKTFIRAELMPRIAAEGEDALPGAAVGGAIGSGKTFIFEAVAAELDMVVLVLKNIRSQWYGQTDVLFERLRRVLESLSKVLIFVDEADTQFGGVGAGEHATERRLTGKIQAMMSDTRLRGRVTWLLMTARIHLLSPDIRRPGRVGDLIIPVLDPEGDDRTAFVRWMVAPVLGDDGDDATLEKLTAATKGFSAANFAAMRGELKSKHRLSGSLNFDGVLAVLHDHLPPPIEDTRRYQTLQALVNCTRRSLLPDPKATDKERAAWADEIRALEAKGIR
ncbi:MAG: AAA family ATPase, partial [Candidatus Hydrogenedentes bacterium]|nr:AAA family ATPase [Candidatus Hydrogenedentota bacterium]